jgi:hypothetical protein
MDYGFLLPFPKYFLFESGSKEDFLSLNSNLFSAISILEYVCAR